MINEEMKGKFLELAQKIWLNPEIIEKIKEDLWKEQAVKVTTVEVEKPKIDIANTDTNMEKIPTEEELSKMSPEEVMVLAKMMIRKKSEWESREKPNFMEMMKKHWY